MPGKIPDRWEAYSSLGKAIEGTRFITFKVPLEKRMTTTLPQEEQFSPEDLVQRIKEAGHTLGLVIDLTNTKRYYPSHAMIQQDVQYAKIFTEGHVVPSDKVISKFFRRVDKFVNDASNADKLVGVHCTHGVNRTGYLVCRYMIDKLDMEPEKALEALSTGRGYPVERENYVADLMKGKRDLSTANDAEDSDEAERDTSWRKHPRDHRPRNGARHENGDKNWREPRSNRHSRFADAEEPHNGHDYPAEPHQPRGGRESWGGREQWGERPQQRDAGWGSSLQNNSGSNRSYGYSHRQSGGWGEQQDQGYDQGYNQGYNQGGWGHQGSGYQGGWNQQRQYGHQHHDSDYNQRGQRHRATRGHNHRNTQYNRRPATDKYKQAGWRSRSQDLS